MAILCYTTKVGVWQTVNEIQKILTQHKITHISIRNEGAMPEAISFTINHNGQPLNFLLPCNHAGVFECLKKDSDVPPKLKNKEHAFRVSWRIAKQWIEVQMAVVDSGLITTAEVFMAHLIISASGETLSNRILNGDGLKLLN